MNHNDLITQIIKRNRNLHDRHRGERCFILGCGPSINRQDLRPLRNEVSIAVSNFFVHPHFNLISPRYYCVAPYHPPISEEAWQEWLKELDGATQKTAMIFGLSDAERNLRGGYFSDRELFFLHFGGSIETMPRDGIDLASPLLPPQSVSIMALTAALAMGFSKIYLLGCDHDWLIHMYQSRHFYPEEKHAFTRVEKMNNEWKDSDLEGQCHCYINLWRQYKALRHLAERSSIQIFNATDGGMLDVFPRVEFANLFKQNQSLESVADNIPTDGGKTLQFIDCTDTLTPALENSKRQRFGKWRIRLGSLTVSCHDLLSFYMAAKDIFIHRIYDFQCDKQNPVIIDGGGHIGLFTLYAKQRFPMAKITVFEPDNLSLELLRSNLTDNNFNDVEIIESGLFKTEGVLSFGSDNSDGGSLFSKKRDSSITVTRLSQHINSPVDFLKLNVEGAEFEVISELEPKLNLINEMVIEYHGFPELSQRLHLILDILDRNGFRYMLHDFDVETNPASKPPFRLAEDTRFFLLVHAKRILQPQDKEFSPSHEITRITPVSRQFGFDRGLPIDRYYIEKFLAANRHFIRGSVLEVGDSAYTRSLGTGVTSSHVLSAAAAPGVTIVGDLATGDNIPESAFDCIIMTQTIQMIYDVRSALANAVKALKPGGVLLLTASGISQISRYDMDRWGEFWRFTDRSLKTLLEECAPEGSLHLETHGNVAVAKAFLDGRALGEIPEETLDYRDDDYQVLISARLEKKAGAMQVDYRARRESVRPPVVLLYHRVADDPIDSQLLAVSPKNFEEQLSVLAASYRVAPLRQLLENADGGPLPDGTMAITFDDGYRDNLVNALPILERFGMHATIFVTSGMIGADEEFWWDAVENIFLTGRPLPETLRIHVNEATKSWPLTSTKERLFAHDEICSIIRSLPPNQIRQAVGGLRTWAGADPRPRPSHLTLNRNELRLLAASPQIEIGSHTVSHGRLSPLSYSEELNEMVMSKRMLEEITGKTVEIVSYPFGSAGDFSRQTIELAAAAGYRFGIANIQADLHTPLDPFAVPRRLVRNWSGGEFSAWLESPAKDRLEAYTLEKRNLRLLGGVPA